MKKQLYRVFFLFGILSTSAFAQPESSAPIQSVSQAGMASVVDILSLTEILGETIENTLRVGDRLFIKSQDLSDEIIIAFVEVTQINIAESLPGRMFFKAHLLSLTGNYIIRKGDSLFPLDLSTENRNYKARTELLYRKLLKGPVSGRYRTLYTQGLGIGETADTLDQDEIFFAWYGLFGYGLTEWWTISSYLPLNALGGPNAQFKFRLLNTQDDKLGTGLSFWKVPGSTETVLNFNFMWDSMSSHRMVSHSFVTLAVLSYDNSKEATAVKSLGSTAIQSGYEFLLPDWSRILTGPSYNFETKALGGYVSYLKIFDRFHCQLSLASTNLSSFKFDIKDGYYAFFDAYWRY